MIDFVSAWLSLIAQSLLPIGVTVVVLWGIDTRIRSLPANYRSWMWRLFFVKCLCIAIVPWYAGIPQLSSISAQLHRVWTSHPASATTRLDTNHANADHSKRMVTATTGGSTVYAVANIPSQLSTDAGRFPDAPAGGKSGAADNQAGAALDSAQADEFASWRGWLGAQLGSDELLVSLFLVWLWSRSTYYKARSEKPRC